MTDMMRDRGPTDKVKDVISPFQELYDARLQRVDAVREVLSETKETNPPQQAEK